MKEWNTQTNQNTFHYQGRKLTLGHDWAVVTAHLCAGVSFGLLAKSSLLSVVNAEMQEVLYAAGLQRNALCLGNNGLHIQDVRGLQGYLSESCETVLETWGGCEISASLIWSAHLLEGEGKGGIDTAFLVFGFEIWHRAQKQICGFPCCRELWYHLLHQCHLPERTVGHTVQTRPPLLHQLNTNLKQTAQNAFVFLSFFFPLRTVLVILHTTKPREQ